MLWYHIPHTSSSFETSVSRHRVTLIVRVDSIIRDLQIDVPLKFTIIVLLISYYLRTHYNGHPVVIFPFHSV